MPTRRTLLSHLAAAPLALTLSGLAHATPRASAQQRLAMAWRGNPPADGTSADRVGLVAIDWAAGTLRIAADLPAPGRAHGLLALPDGGFLAVAMRPGRWLMRIGSDGQVMRQIDLDTAIDLLLAGRND